MTSETPSASPEFTTDVPTAPLVSLILKNLALAILTLGIYRFWGKTHIRRLLWTHTLIQGERLEYTGTGGELFKGFLLVLVTVFIPLFLLNLGARALVEQEEIRAAGAVYSIFAAVALYLPGVAIYRAARYRLSRTRWRGVRFSLEGKGWAYGVRVMLFLLALGLTLGLSYPVQRVNLWRQMWNRVHFGDKPFHFEGGARSLYPRFLLAWVVGMAFLLGLPAFIAITYAPTYEPPGGIPLVDTSPEMALLLIPLLFILLLLPLWIFYKAVEMRTLAGSLSFQGIRFTFDVRSWPLIRLLLGNLLLVLMTLGLGGPFATVRSLQFVCARLRPVGETDFAAIAQGAQPAPASGEGLAEMFDSVDI